MAYSDIIEAIHGDVDTELATYTIQHENDAEGTFAKPDDKAWVRASIKCGDSAPISVGTKHRFRLPGVLFLSIFSPVGSREGEINTIADTCIAAWAYKRLLVSDSDNSVVIFNTPTVSNVGQFAGVYQVNVKCSFTVDLLK